jgi:disulfide oxidoreductase YuzD
MIVVRGHYFYRFADENSNASLRVDVNTVAVAKIYTWSLAAIQRENPNTKFDLQHVYAKRIYIKNTIVHVVLETGDEVLYPVYVEKNK